MSIKDWVLFPEREEPEKTWWSWFRIVNDWMGRLVDQVRIASYRGFGEAAGVAFTATAAPGTAYATVTVPEAGVYQFTVSGFLEYSVAGTVMSVNLEITKADNTVMNRTRATIRGTGTRFRSLAFVAQGSLGKDETVTVRAFRSAASGTVILRNCRVLATRVS